MLYTGSFCILRNFDVIFRDKQDRITDKSLFVAGVVLSFDGWLINIDKPIDIIYKTTINGYHKYIKDEQNRKIKSSSVQRMTYKNCYLGFFIPSLRCAVPFTQDYFISVKQHEKGLFLAESKELLTPIDNIDLHIGVSPYKNPKLNLEYIHWLQSINRSSVTADQKC